MNFICFLFISGWFWLIYEANAGGADSANIIETVEDVGRRVQGSVSIMADALHTELSNQIQVASDQMMQELRSIPQKLANGQLTQDVSGEKVVISGNVSLYIEHLHMASTQGAISGEKTTVGEEDNSLKQVTLNSKSEVGSKNLDIVRYKEEAEEGDPESSYKLAVIYAEQCTNGSNDSEILRLCKQSADKRHAPAEYMLAELYESGRYGEHLYIDLYVRSAKQGFADAQYKLATFYESGEFGFTQDISVALSLYERAASQSHGEACYKLGAHRYKQKDVTQARVWYERGQRNSMNCRLALRKLGPGS